MAGSRRNVLLALAALLALGLVGVIAWVVALPTASTTSPIAFPEASSAGTPAPAPNEDDSTARQASVLSSPSLEPTSPEEETTVVFPLRVELELVRAESMLQGEGAPRRGSAATARIKGTIIDGSGNGVRAQVEVKAGPNAGRVLYCDARGQFGANDLYPGRVLLDVTGPGIPGSLREYVLRQQRETLVNIGYGRLAQVTGEVLDDAGAPLDGAKVTMDGQVATTDPTGTFFFSGMTSGESTVYVEKPGFATLFQTTTITAGQTVEKGRLKFRLARGARLQITLADRINASQPATVFLLPSSLNAQRSYPWFKVNPIYVNPGHTVVVEDLPVTSVAVRLYHPGAVAVPAQREVVLDAGLMKTVELTMEPTPVVVGVVTMDGKPVDHAEVSLEAPDRVSATLSSMGEADFLMLESEVLPDSPLAVQRVFTNALGEFQLSRNESVSKVRYLVARSSDGKAQGGVVLTGGEERADLALKPIQADGENGSELILATSPRFQALPVDVVVNGEPRGRTMLPADRDLHVDGLVPGTWRVKVDWESDHLLAPQTIDLKKEVTLEVKLPEGAVLGQDEETRKRAR